MVVAVAVGVVVVVGVVVAVGVGVVVAVAVVVGVKLNERNMSKDTKMTMDAARTIALRCEKALEVAGRVYVSFPYNPIDLADALIFLNRWATVQEQSVTREEHTKLIRQMTALRARYIRLAKKHNEVVKESDDEENG